MTVITTTIASSLPDVPEFHSDTAIPAYPHDTETTEPTSAEGLGDILLGDDNNTHYVHAYSATFVFAEHYALVVYLMLVIVVGLLSNSFVVYATLKYSSFNLDKVTIAFVRHLAVTDLLMVSFIGIPMTYVHLEQPIENPFYRHVCTILGFIYEILVHSHIMFYLAIAAHRFIRCIFPLKLQTITLKQGRWCCVGIWALGVTLSTATAAAMSGNHVEFYMGMAMCAAETVEMGWYWFNMLYTLVMMLLIIILNVIMLLYSTYVNDHARVKSRNVLEARITVAIMSLCAVLSNVWVPYNLITHLLGSSGNGATDSEISDSGTADGALWDHTGQKILTHLPIVTALINPLIYTIVNRRFKEFLINELRRTQRRLFLRPQVREVKQQSAEMRTLGLVTRSVNLKTSPDVSCMIHNSV